MNRSEIAQPLPKTAVEALEYIENIKQELGIDDPPEAWRRIAHVLADKLAMADKKAVHWQKMYFSLVNGLSQYRANPDYNQNYTPYYNQ